MLHMLTLTLPLVQRAIEALGIDTRTIDFEQWWTDYLRSEQA